MEIFEVHITGSSSYILYVLRKMYLKGIQIELLTPDQDVLRTEYMSSLIIRADNYQGTSEVELCLFDSYIEEDFDWFKLYSLQEI